MGIEYTLAPRPHERGIVVPKRKKMGHKEWMTKLSMSFWHRDNQDGIRTKKNVTSTDTTPEPISEDRSKYKRILPREGGQRQKKRSRKLSPWFMATKASAAPPTPSTSGSRGEGQQRTKNDRENKRSWQFSRGYQQRSWGKQRQPLVLLTFAYVESASTAL